MKGSRDDSIVTWIVRYVVGGVVRVAKFVLMVCLKIIGRWP